MKNDKIFEIYPLRVNSASKAWKAASFVALPIDELTAILFFNVGWREKPLTEILHSH